MIHVYGLPPFMEDAATWACEQLGISEAELVFDLDVVPSGFHGELLDYDDGQFFLVIEETLDYRDSLIALFHELIHVQQVLSGRLSLDESTWEGIPVRDYDEPTYELTPWEREAFQKEGELFERYGKYDAKSA